MFDGGVSGTKPEYDLGITYEFGNGFCDRVRNSHSECVAHSDRPCWIQPVARGGRTSHDCAGPGRIGGSALWKPRRL